MTTKVDQHVFVIFGGTGDLARRKLIPSLYRLITENDVADRCVLLGVATGDLDDDEYRAWTRDALRETGLSDTDLEAWCDDNVFYQKLGRDSESYGDLRRRIESIESDRGLPGNRAFYLALPPPVFPAAITGLGEAGLSESPGWTRLVIEKPIGTDLASARELNEVVHEFFDESQIYRIDHYLGKESVQNLLVFRFANAIFEPIWNRNYIDHVQITVAEDVGVGHRAGYYDNVGVLRDMFQNHILQLLALTAMEAPVAFTADAVRDEKLKILRSLRPIKGDEALKQTFRAQYVSGWIKGKRVAGYKDEEGVPQLLERVVHELHIAALRATAQCLERRHNQLANQVGVARTLRVVR